MQDPRVTVRRTIKHRRNRGSFELILRSCDRRRIRGSVNHPKSDAPVLIFVAVAKLPKCHLEQGWLQMGGARRHVVDHGFGVGIWVLDVSLAFGYTCLE